MKAKPAILSLAIALIIPSAQAAITVDSSGFNAVTNGAIDTSGAMDWGFVSAGGLFGATYLGGVDYSNLTDGSSNVITTVKAGSSNGAVIFTQITALSPNGNVSNYTFDGSTAHGSVANFAADEDNALSYTFNDLGVGQFIISLYLGHNQGDRNFEMDVSGSGLSTFSQQSGQIQNLGSTVAGIGTGGAAFTYDIMVTTTAATDDLTLVFGSLSGSSGQGVLAGYTVTQIPEPAAAMLGVLGSLLLLRRRRA